MRYRLRTPIGVEIDYGVTHRARRFSDTRGSRPLAALTKRESKLTGGQPLLDPGLGEEGANCASINFMGRLQGRISHDDR